MNSFAHVLCFHDLIYVDDDPIELFTTASHHYLCCQQVLLQLLIVFRI
jgi:hypothetical protein